MPKKSKKPRVAIVGLTCCEGCEFAILDLHNRFLELTSRVDFTEFRMIKEDPKIMGPYDICFLEGSAITQGNFQRLKKLRQVSKMLIVLGNCAHTGGVHRMKNWLGRYRALESVYKNYKGLENPPIYPVGEIVKVDFTIPTCPINAEEFLKILNQILAGHRPQIKQFPVCYECQINGFECLLQKGEICLGPVTLGGCEAICLKSKQACWGCRGLLVEPDVEKFTELLMEDHTREEVDAVLEVFGVKDDWHQQALKEWDSQNSGSKALMVVKPGKIQKSKKTGQLMVIKK